ncbi:MAG: lycopene cyclase, partial [Sphingomonadales bacterium]
MSATIRCDVAILGGGLAGGLIALALRARRPDCDIRLIEAGRSIGGNHLWSFFASDIAPEHRWLTAPLVSHGWTGYDVRFPAHARTLKAAYYSIESTRLDALVRAALPAQAVMTGRTVLTASPTSVALDDGDRIEAGGVIDCRGAGDLSALDCGWQKFLGRVQLWPSSSSTSRPVIMDATVEQLDGYRFVYLLPFTATRMFVEDTYYSDTPDLDVPGLRRRIDLDIAARGWRVDTVIREEAGVLAVAMGGDFEGYWRSGGDGLAKAGVRGGLFHPLTSYSLPDAVRTAALIAAAPDLSGAAAISA